jgi:hypothetical protein
MLLLSSQRLKSLNLRKEYGSKHKSHKERVGENFFGFGLWKTTGEAPQQPENQQPNKWSSWGTYTPHKENQLLENWSGEDRSIRGPVDGRSLVWRVIDNMVWTDSWLSIAGVGCDLICVGAGEEQARKVLALRGLWGVERQVGSAWWTRWPNKIKCGPHGGKKSKVKSWTRAGAG